MRGIHWWPVNSPHKGSVSRIMLPFDDVIMITSVAKWTPRQVQRKVSIHFTLQESPTYFRTCSKKILPLCNYIDNIGAHLGQCFPCQKVLFVNAITGDKHVLCEHVLYIDMCTLGDCCTVNLKEIIPIMLITIHHWTFQIQWWDKRT